jgi:undecaprenyl-diphosphatase
VNPVTLIAIPCADFGGFLNVYLLAALLGIIEGLTEFLPVSSTAHLRIAEEFLHVSLSSGYWKMFSIVIQLGAILCLPIYFRHRIAEFFSTFPRGKRGDRTWLTHPVSLTAIAFVLTAVPAFLLTRIIGQHLENLYIMALSLVIGGVVMWIVDVLYDRQVLSTAQNRTGDMDRMSLPQAIWIGACQTLSAVFPGTSRSMATIAAGQVARMSRTAALEFSFFVSIPTMLAATGYTLFKSIRHGEAGSAIGAAPATINGWVVLAIGFGVSFVVAYAVVAWFMHWVQRRGFIPFAVYRIVFGLIVLWWALHI